MSALPKTRTDAFAAGADRYFTGVPCRHGHIAERYVSGSCVGCREAHYQRRAPEIKARFQAARDADREGVKQRRNEWYARTKATRGPKRNAHMRKRFFYARAVNLRGPGHATARDLAAIWKRQRGLCALTGRRLDRSAEIDHIIPRVRHGGDAPGNLRWVVKDANRAKRDLLDDDFIALCRDIVRRADA